MSEHKIQEVIYSSKNKQPTETIDDLVITLPNGYISCQKDEYMTVQIQDFFMIKTFINTASYNNHFQVLERDLTTLDVKQTYDLYIPSGSYDIRGLLNALNDLTFAYKIKWSYKQYLNAWEIQRTAQEVDVFYSILSITAQDFIGIGNGLQVDVKYQQNVTTSFLNPSGINRMYIELSGDINLIKTSVATIQQRDMKTNQVVAIIPLNDVPSMANIIYRDQNHIQIGNKTVNNIRVRLINDQGYTFERLSDYSIRLVFKKHSIIDRAEIYREMRMLESYLSRIYLLIGRVYENLMLYIKKDGESR